MCFPCSSFLLPFHFFTCFSSQLPLETLSLLDSSRFLFLDHESDLFIWIGKEMKLVNDASGISYVSYLNALISRARKQSQYRCPTAKIHLIREENRSASRLLSCRLSPSHHDPFEQQLISFPNLRQYGNEEERERLYQTKLPMTNELSFREWFGGLFE